MLLLSDAEIKAFVERERPRSWYARHYTELRNAIYSTMLHGVRYDKDTARTKSAELVARKLAIKTELLELTGGVKLWSEKSHRSPELEELLDAQRRVKAEYNAIPKEDRGARKAFRSNVQSAADALRSCRDSGRDKVVEIGTGLSDDKICEYLYGTLGIPAIRKRRKESNKISVTADDIALKKIRLKYPQHSRLIQLILEHRKAAKLMGYLNEDMIDPDGRIRTMYKPFGTQSGRLSSSENPLGTGTNLQNFDRSLKTLLLPDEG